MHPPTQPDNTAVRTALWRALHVQADAKPHILKDELGQRLVAPPGMVFTKRLRYGARPIYLLICRCVDLSNE